LEFVNYVHIKLNGAILIIDMYCFFSSDA